MTFICGVNMVLYNNSLDLDLYNWEKISKETLDIFNKAFQIESKLGDSIFLKSGILRIVW